MGLDLDLKEVTVNKEYFASENGMEYVISCANLNSASGSTSCNDKINLEGTSKLHHGIYLVEQNNPYDGETPSQEIVVNEITLAEKNELKRPHELKKSSPILSFNIKLKRKIGRKVKIVNPTKNDNFKTEDLFSYQHESDLCQIVSNVKKNMNDEKRLDKFVKKIMFDGNTKQYRFVATPRNSGNESINFEKPNLCQMLNDSKECPSSPVSNCNPHLTMEDWEPDFSGNNGRIPEDLTFKEIKFIKGLNPNIYFTDKQKAFSSRNNTGRKGDKIIYWLEGNIDKVNEPICLSTQLIRSFSTVDQLDISYEIELANLKNEKASFSNVCLSWESVKERIEELEEEAQTRFINYYKTPAFKENPQPFKKIHFEMNTYRKDNNIVIPFNGIPFIFIGLCIFSCHLGNYRKNNELLRGKINNSKKIGCPATLSVVKIARFPDFDISSLSVSAKGKAILELKNAWDLQTSKVRYYIEYCIREPQISDHKFHDIQSQNNKFLEPVDPRILNRIHLLTKQGITSSRKMESLISSFVKNDLFNGEDVPSNRRRFNPTTRDIQYNIHKAKEEMKKEGSNKTREQCVSLANEIASTVMNISNEQYLHSIKTQLYNVAASLKKGDHSNFSSLQDFSNSESSVSFDPKYKQSKEKNSVSFIAANEMVAIDTSGGNSVQIFEQDPLDFLFEHPSTDMGPSTNPESGSFYLTPQELAAGLQHHVEHFEGEQNDDNTEGLLYLIPNGTFYHN